MARIYAPFQKTESDIDQEQLDELQRIMEAATTNKASNELVTENAMQEEPMREPAAQPSPEMSDLERAYDARNKQRLYGDLLAGFQQIIAGGAGTKADMSMADQIRQRSEEPVTKYKQERKEEKEAKAEKRQTELDELSKRFKEQQISGMKGSEERAQSAEMRKEEKHPFEVEKMKDAVDYAKIMAKKQGIDLKSAGIDLENKETTQRIMTAKQGPLAFSLTEDVQAKLNKLAKENNTEPEMIQKGDMSVQELILLQKHLDEGKGGLNEYQKLRLEHEKKKDQRIEDEQTAKRKDKIYGVVKDFENDSVVKELKKQNVSFGQAEALLDAMKNDNKVAVGALGTKMARAMGEVGVLTDADVIRYIQRMDVEGRVKDFFSRTFKGKVSDFTQKDLEDISNIMQIGARKKMGEVREKYINYAHNNFGERTGMSKQETEKMFGIKPAMVRILDPKGQVRLIPANQVDAAIEAGGKKVE